MQQKADLMRLYVANGYTNLDSIRKHYNTFNEGGPTETQSENKSGWQKAKEVAYDVLEFVDPTGISSYATSEGDLRQAIEGYKKGTAFLEHFYGIPENETNKYDDGGPIDNDLYYSNIDPVEVTTAKRKVNIPEDPLSKEGRKQAQFYLNRIKSGDMTFEGVPESYKKVVNNYITGDKLVYKGRENSQYKGLNQMMQNLILGGPAGLVLDTAFKSVGSIYNGYNVFDPEHPGLFTKEYSDKHPYLTTAVNMAASLPFGAWDTYMASNMDDFNDLSSVNRRSPGGNRPTKKQARQQINSLENTMKDLKVEDSRITSDEFEMMLKDRLAFQNYGMSYSQLSDHIRKYIDSMHKTIQKVRTRYSIQSMPVLHTYHRENIPIYKVLANHENITDQPKSVYALLGTSYIKDDIGNLQVYKDSNGVIHVFNNGMSENIPTELLQI